MDMRAIINLVETALSDGFRTWFAGSKVVDQEGNPLLVYHGTASPKFDRFEHGKAKPMDGYWYGKGFYFTPDPEAAKMYADRMARTYHQDTSRARVDHYYLRLRNPYLVYREFMPGSMALRNTMWKDFGEEWHTQMPGWDEKLNPNIFVTYVASDFLKGKGYDGVIALGYQHTPIDHADEIVVFDADDIMSAEKVNGDP